MNGSIFSKAISPSLGHGPFSHMFDGMFIPKARPGFKWKVLKYSLTAFPITQTPVSRSGVAVCLFLLLLV
jgi:hypothetical protein